MSDRCPQGSEAELGDSAFLPSPTSSPPQVSQKNGSLMEVERPVIFYFIGHWPMGFCLVFSIHRLIVDWKWQAINQYSTVVRCHSCFEVCSVSVRSVFNIQNTVSLAPSTRSHLFCKGIHGGHDSSKRKRNFIFPFMFCASSTSSPRCPRQDILPLHPPRRNELLRRTAEMHGSYPRYNFPLSLVS